MLAGMESSLEPKASPETARYVLNHTKGALAQQLVDVDAMDSKAMSVFGVASTVIGLAAFAFAGGGGAFVTILLVPAIVAYGAAAVFFFMSVQSREYTGGHYASSLWKKFGLQSVETIEQALAAAIPLHFERNLALIRWKVRTLGGAMRALAAETGFIAVALLVSRF